MHLLDGRVEGMLLREFFSGAGGGVMIYTNRYSAIRPMRAEDIASVLRIMRPLIDCGLLLPRNHDELVAALSRFVVHETDGTIHGCAALNRLTDAVGEISALAVEQRWEQRGIGAALVEHLIERALETGLERIVVLTTAAPDWFERLGFRTAPLDTLPPTRREQYDTRRRPRLLQWQRCQ